MRNGKIVSSWTQELARPGSLLAGNWGGPSKRLRNIYMQGLEETGIDDTDFQILEVFLNRAFAGEHDRAKGVPYARLDQ
jgi:hypothetical protein